MRRTFLALMRPLLEEKGSCFRVKSSFLFKVMTQEKAKVCCLGSSTSSQKLGQFTYERD